MGKQKKRGPFNQYKGELRQEIQTYCRENNISKEDFHFLPINNWENVYKKIVDSFVDYEWAKHSELHWANTNGGLKKEVIYAFDSYETWEWVLKLPEFLEGKYDKLYYVVEDWGDKFWISEGTPEVIAQLLYEEMYDDDYFIIDTKFHWMITCNHHCIVLFVGEEISYVAEKCKEMIQAFKRENIKEEE